VRHNKRTVAAERALADAAAKITGALGAGAFEGDAHALLMAVYKDVGQPIDLRVLAAKAARHGAMKPAGRARVCNDTDEGS